MGHGSWVMGHGSWVMSIGEKRHHDRFIDLNARVVAWAYNKPRNRAHPHSGTAETKQKPREKWLTVR
jgi:hypothetical protein